VQTVDGWVYTATVIDLHSRKVVGYAVADHLRTSLIVEALAAALLTRKPPRGVIFHSDRGCQYTSREFADFCAENGVVRSMGRRATCFDCETVLRRSSRCDPVLDWPCGCPGVDLSAGSSDPSKVGAPSGQ
jgi:transposase InsO family protein